MAYGSAQNSARVALDVTLVADEPHYRPAVPSLIRLTNKAVWPSWRRVDRRLSTKPCGAFPRAVPRVAKDEADQGGHIVELGQIWRAQRGRRAEACWIASDKGHAEGVLHEATKSAPVTWD